MEDNVSTDYSTVHPAHSEAGGSVSSDGRVAYNRDEMPWLNGKSATGHFLRLTLERVWRFGSSPAA